MKYAPHVSTKIQEPLNLQGFIKKVRKTQTLRTTLSYYNSPYSGAVEITLSSLPEFNVDMVEFEHDFFESLKPFMRVNLSDTLYGNHIINCDLTVVEKPEEYKNLYGDKFIVNDNEFTNEELIKAVKQTFPERFI